VLDPDTNKVLKELSNNIAILDITSVDPTTATGSIIKGGGVRVGDSVKKVSTEVAAIVITPVPGTETHSSMSATGAILEKKPAPEAAVKEAAVPPKTTASSKPSSPKAEASTEPKSESTKKNTTAAANAKSTTK
jgi:hypothetical protein